MGIRGEKVKALKSVFDPVVVLRDRGMCVLCNEPYWDVHEIISRSQFSTPELERCILPQNMVCLCRTHHTEAQGNLLMSGKLLRMLADEYEYNYDKYPYNWYIQMEIGIIK